MKNHYCAIIPISQKNNLEAKFNMHDDTRMVSGRDGMWTKADWLRTRILTTELFYIILNVWKLEFRLNGKMAWLAAWARLLQNKLPCQVEGSLS